MRHVKPRILAHCMPLLPGRGIHYASNAQPSESQHMRRAPLETVARPSSATHCSQHQGARGMRRARTLAYCFFTPSLKAWMASVRTVPVAISLSASAEMAVCTAAARTSLSSSSRTSV